MKEGRRIFILAIVTLALVFSLVREVGAAAIQGYRNSSSTIAPLPTQLSTLTTSSFLQSASAVSAGYVHTCALSTSGGVKCWGANSAGQLGDGTVTNRYTPVDVSGLTSGVSSVSAGSAHTCALTTSGGIMCWGANYYGELGDGTTTDQSTPVDVSGLTSGAIAISAGGDYTCTLTITGRVMCWGRNFAGQLGDGTTTDSSTPINVSGMTNGVRAISAGEAHTCALTTSGGVKCWGFNYYGQLGDGTRASSITPVDVLGLSNDVVAVSAGGNHTCALTDSGGVKCWGENEYGQLGNGTTTDSTTSMDVSGLTSGAISISAGRFHTCALTDIGGVKCWGLNADGLLGDGTMTSQITPMDVSGLTRGISAISANVTHTCALTMFGGIKCWGDNYYGQLGDGTTTNLPTPMDVYELTNWVTAISAGVDHTCALTTAGGVKCWGGNYEGRLGVGTTIDHSTPMDVLGLTSGVSALSASWIYTCVITTSGGAKCWGENSNGQLGDGTTSNRTTPVDVSGLTSNMVSVSTGGVHSCALTTSNGIKCWGSNYYGQLGDGTTISHYIPVDVLGLSDNVVAVSAGRNHTCALTDSGGVKCWGENTFGQLGDGTAVNRSTPVDVLGLTSGVRAISAGLVHTCAITTSGGIKCWGYNSTGQLGDGTKLSSYTPVNVLGLSSGISAVSSGAHHTCALTILGGVMCWGDNYEGELGDGTFASHYSPVDVNGLTSGISAISSGWDHTCALTISGGAKCWGANPSGQLGWKNIWVPVDVIGFEGEELLTITGIIRDRSGFPIEGVTVTSLSGYQAVTNNLGNYYFPTLPAGLYLIKPTKPGYSFSPGWQYANVSSFTAGSSIQVVETIITRYDFIGVNDGGSTSPFLDLPFDYSGAGSETFTQITQDTYENGRIDSWFDHKYPGSNNFSHSGMWTYKDIVITGNRISNGLICYGMYCYDGHDGYDFWPKDKINNKNEVIKAAGDGKVVNVGWESDRFGNYVVVYHDEGYFTLYGHLIETRVTNGDLVLRGVTEIGLMGTTGRSTGDHLHFGVYKDKNGNRILDFGSDPQVDPFGWENEVSDPWAAHASGAVSQHLWIPNNYTQELTIGEIGGLVVGPSGMSQVNLLPGIITGQGYLKIIEGIPITLSDLYNRLVGFSIRILPLEWLNSDGSKTVSLSNTMQGEIEPYSVQFTYADLDLNHLDETQLSIYQKDLSGTWVVLPSQFDHDNKIVSANVPSLGDFSIQAPLLCPQDMSEPLDDKTYLYPEIKNTMGSNSYLRWFDIQMDIDYIPVYLMNGISYWFTTLNLSSGVDTVLTLYVGDGVTELATNDNYGEELASRVEFQPAESGTYYIKVSQAEGSAFGCDSSYELQIENDAKTVFLPMITK